ncbi:MAG: cytochrome c biogenesis protein CcsA [Verrucomicrobia bacterium]|nr:cytochrome c biogenesis protein CcsA [Verrucomicrobiota bacterium]
MVHSVFVWRKGFRQDNRVNYFLLLAAFALHTIAMVKRGFSLERCPVNNLYEATTFVVWSIVAAYLVIGLWQRVRFLGAFASPVLFAMGVFALMPRLDVHKAQPEFSGGWLSLHITLILLGYGAFGLSAVAGGMYLTQEHNLKFNKLRAFLSRLPSIERLETVLWRALVAGFVLLTVGLAMGMFGLRQQQPAASPLADTKVLWSLFVWLVYLFLIFFHWRFAQGGRRFAWGVVVSFAFILLTFWGANLLSNIHNP